MKKIDRLVERCAAYLESLHTDKKTGFYACAAAALRRMPPELLHKNPSNIARPSAPAHQALYEALSALWEDSKEFHDSEFDPKSGAHTECGWCKARAALALA